MNSKKKVLLGMSGGVDSSVGAVLLLEQGYEVIGGFMKNWSGETDATDHDALDGSPDCGWKAERRDAMRVAAQLGIPFQTFDFEKEYRERVYEYMIAEYKAGRTPNPDVLCNKYMKFDLFLRAADELGCDYVATGHYARIRRDEDGTAHLLVGVDQSKDQSYFLCQLTQEQISRAMFPVGDLQKSEVRDIARKNNLVVAEKKDSQGICFVGKVAMADFLGKRIAEHEGNIVTTDGKILGKHKGFEFYTVGQREGLGIGGRKRMKTEKTNEDGWETDDETLPLYVIERRPETNEIVVAVGDNDPALFKTTLRATNVAETYSNAFRDHVGKKIFARIRYRQQLASCSFVTPGSTRGPATELEVCFDAPQRAVAPGQFVAFYDGEELLGSGVIL